MGLFDFLKSKEKITTHSIEPKTKREECNITKTGIIDTLLGVPKNQRDEKWRDSFLENVKTASFACTNPQVINGPDGFPYFGLKIPQSNVPFESFCINNIKDDFLLDQGIGVAINPSENTADFVFSYGDIVNLHLNNIFFSKQGNLSPTKKEIIEKEEQVLIAQPSEKYLPKQTRNVIKHYLQHIGIKTPKMMLLARKEHGESNFYLVFNLFPENFPSEQQFMTQLNQLTWFLPKHYAIQTIAPMDSKLLNGLMEI